MSMSRRAIAPVLSFVLVIALAAPASAWSVLALRFKGPDSGTIQPPDGCPGFTVGYEALYNRTLVGHLSKDGVPTGVNGTLNASGFFINLSTGKRVQVMERGSYVATLNPDFSPRVETVSGKADFFLIPGDKVMWGGQLLPTPGIYQITGQMTMDNTTGVGTLKGTKLISFCSLLAAP